MGAVRKIELDVPSTPQPQVINSKFFVYSYFLLFLMIPVIFFDKLVAEHALKNWLGENEAILALHFYLFGLPHVLAGNLTLVDRSFFKAYQKRIFIFLPVLIAGLGLLHFYFPEYAFTVYMVLTGKHFIFQQFGLARGMARLEGKLIDILAWLTTFAFALVYIPVGDIFADPQKWFMHLYWGLIVIQVILTCVIIFKAKGNLGRIFLLVNGANLLVAAVSLEMGYFFLSSLMVRVPHDLVSFMTYANYNANKAQAEPDYWVNKIMKLGVPAMVVTLIVAITIAAPVTRFFYLFPVLLLNDFLVYVHYYCESFVWKRGSPFRNYLKIA